MLMMSPGAAFGEELPGTPDAVPPTVETSPDATEIPSEPALPTDTPTELPATLAPTDMLTATLPPTIAPTVTSEPPTAPPATDFPTVAPPTATDSPMPTASATATATPAPALYAPAEAVYGAASTDTFTVDGLQGTVIVYPGSTQTFAVGDLLDMAGDGFGLIQSSNPDPDFYRLNGWWTSNTFLVYAGRGCHGQFIAQYYTPYMQPSSGSATATLSGPTITYSVQASQTLTVWWMEKSIDIVDSVDEVHVYPQTSTAPCINVELASDPASLMANSSYGPVTVAEGELITLLSDMPSGSTWTQSIYEGSGAWCSGTLSNLVSGGPGSLVGTNLVRKPGTYWFGLRSTDGATLRYGNCVQVTVQDVPAQLRINGSTSTQTFITGQTVALYVEGFKPAVPLLGLVYLNNSCTGTAYSLTTGTADAQGTLDTSARIDLALTVSVQFVSLNPNQTVLEATNCVVLAHQATSIYLEVNGSTGPVLVDGGEIHLIATGLPSGTTAYAALNCDGPFEPDDFGQTIGSDGIFEAYMSDDLPDEFGIRVVLGPDYVVSSNCVHVRLVTYLIDPQIEINGSTTPDPVVSGATFTLTGLTFPPDAAVTIRTYTGADCTGDSTVSGAQSDNEGNFSLDPSAGAAGMISVQAETGGQLSNCVPLEITAVQVTPTDTPTPSPTATVVVPTGPITLFANGETDPQTLPGGAAANFTATGLGDREAYSLASYPNADCSGTIRPLGTGFAGSGQVGTMTRYIASTIGVRLTAGQRTSNCVEVSWQAVPATATPTASPTQAGGEVPATATPTEQSVTATPTEPSTAVSPTATASPTESDGVSTATPEPTLDGTTATATATDPDATSTALPTAVNPEQVTPNPTREPVTKLPSTGVAPAQGQGSPLSTLLVLAVAVILGVGSMLGRRAMRR